MKNLGNNSNNQLPVVRVFNFPKKEPAFYKRLVVLILLFAAILQSQPLIESYRVRAASNYFKSIPAALYVYSDRYLGFPGDDGPLSKLRSRGGIWSVAISPHLTGGDANGILVGNIAAAFDPKGETLAFWQHLRAAGFIPGSPEATGILALPRNSFGGQTGINSSLIQGMQAGHNKLCMNNVPGASAFVLDGRLDDGLPNSGNFRANAATSPSAIAATSYLPDLRYTVCNRL